MEKDVVSIWYYLSCVRYPVGGEQFILLDSMAREGAGEVLWQMDQDGKYFSYPSIGESHKEPKSIGETLDFTKISQTYG